MKFTAGKDKITDKHLRLLAVIYIRQSSKRQVEENKGSATYQRSFIELARRHGWQDDLIQVNDIDLGVSGRSVAGREGYKLLRQQIFEERVGAVLCSEESRLGRNFSDFVQLIKLCAVYNTLIIDEKGVYDPNNSNDLVTLGIVGLFSDAESMRNADRSAAIKRELAEAGQLLLPPPTGYVYDEEDKLVFDPDEKVRDAVNLLFSKFDEYGVAIQVVKYFNRHGVLFPTRIGMRIKNRRINWVKLRIGRVLGILHNPVFAGAFVYGRSVIDLKMVSPHANEEKKTRSKLSWDADEVILIRDMYKPYITWERFLQNQERLKDNRYIFNLESKGAARGGASLLQGIVKCGACRRSMYAHYAVWYGKQYPRYVCNH